LENPLQRVRGGARNAQIMMRLSGIAS